MILVFPLTAIGIYAIASGTDKQLYMGGVSLGRTPYDLVQEAMDELNKHEEDRQKLLKANASPPGFWGMLTSAHKIECIQNLEATNKRLLSLQALLTPKNKK